MECLYVEFEVSRRYSHYIIMVYVPSFLLMALGGLVFWLPLEALWERLCVSMLLLVLQTIVMVTSQLGTPQVK